jgi:hypothetical protein
MEPYPDRDEQPEGRTGGRGGVIVAVVIAAIFLGIVVLHLTVGVSPHGR